MERNLLLDTIGLVAGLNVLDVGCGDGQLSLALAQVGAHVSAIDTDFRMLEAARYRFEVAATEVRLAEADVRELPFANASFDVVAAVTVLCLIPQPDQAISEMTRVLKPGGQLIIGELNHCSLWATWRRLRAWLGNTIWRAAHFHSAKELYDLAVRAGLVVHETRAAIFYPPVGWIAALFAPVDRWLSRRIINGGAFIILAATKPCSK
ncbi:MAG: methyltransferase domain-containing protein [Fimbriimonadaceae bacterium]|nr:methyltransferase domain-containing protein [Alphaproteobacteria bacterium]